MERELRRLKSGDCGGIDSVTRLRSSRSTPLRRRRGKTKKVFKIAHIIWPLMKETKNVSKSIIYEGNDRILLSESNLRSGFPVNKSVSQDSKLKGIDIDAHKPIVSLATQ